MPDGLTPSAQIKPTRSRVVLLQALAIVVVLAIGGALCGVLWFRLWDPPAGVVSDGQWVTDEAGLRAGFSGTGGYVAIAAVAGLVLGVLLTLLLDRSELVTLVAVACGSVLAGYLMLEVGMHLGPADPHTLARTAADGTRLDGALRAPGWPPRLAFPLGALLGLLGVLLASGRREPATATLSDP